MQRQRSPMLAVPQSYDCMRSYVAKAFLERCVKIATWTWWKSGQAERSARQWPHTLLSPSVS